MNLADAIAEIYPALTPGVDYEVRDDSNGRGPYLASWNNPNPRPTDAELRAAWFGVAKKVKAKEFTTRQLREIATLYPQVKDGEPIAWVAEMLLDIAQALRTTEQTIKLKGAADLRAKRDRGHQKIAAADPVTTTAEQVLAMRWEDA